MTLEQKLDELGIERGDDRGLFIRDDHRDMAVSRRYLEGGWKEILQKEIDVCNEYDLVFILK